VAVVAAVAAWALGGQTPNPGTSIAVLAFEQYSSSGEDESVAAQVTDGVTSELARLGTLSVVSHTSAMQFAGERKPVREIAAALDADVILEGSIQNNPDGIVAVVRLVNAATDRKMWVENFPGQTNDIPGLNRRIAAAVSAAVLERIPAR
jgi:TolB-like protein